MIAQQIMTLQGAVQRGEKRVIFEDVRNHTKLSLTNLVDFERSKRSDFNTCYRWTFCVYAQFTPMFQMSVSSNGACCQKPCGIYPRNYRSDACLQTKYSRGMCDFGLKRRAGPECPSPHSPSPLNFSQHAKNADGHFRESGFRGFHHDESGVRRAVRSPR